ncbi:MAG: HDIG domain-containing protein [Candidatus Omnitrophica bacterium]|nr:HDIG domain-containing protein [Candidatus Omnitrophota bacterium]
MSANKIGKMNASSVPASWAGHLAALLAFALVCFFCVLMGYSLGVPLVLLFVGAHLHCVKKVSFRRFLHVGFLLTLILFAAFSIDHYTDISSYYIPVASVSMLAMLLFNDPELAFILSFTSSFLVTQVLGGGFGMMSIFFIGGLTGAYAVEGARTRGHLIAAGLFISAMQLVAAFATHYGHGVFLTHDFAARMIYPLAWNGFIATFATAATLKIFEYLFRTLTNFSLLELSDFNQPLLRRMILEAPGTYHHSLVVSNLAEAAANAVGANGLLARVGAYYHDTGKLSKPGYFTENQMVGGNKHDDIEPSMSRLVILNHVKEGLEIAKKYRLNPIILAFIVQHHGTGLVYYFYKKALENATLGEAIDEGDFRYPGPKPQTRETAIVSLADSAEAAVRGIEEPNLSKIEATVKRVINNKFIDGQLDECPLTLKDINAITDTFIRILGAMYHSRVRYPEKKNVHNG